MFVFAVPIIYWVFFLVVQKETETWTTIKNSYFIAKTMIPAYLNRKPVCLSRLYFFS